MKIILQKMRFENRWEKRGNGGCKKHCPPQGEGQRKSDSNHSDVFVGSGTEADPNRTAAQCCSLEVALFSFIDPIVEAISPEYGTFSRKLKNYGGEKSVSVAAELLQRAPVNLYFLPTKFHFKVVDNHSGGQKKGQQICGGLSSLQAGQTELAGHEIDHGDIQPLPADGQNYSPPRLSQRLEKHICKDQHCPQGQGEALIPESSGADGNYHSVVPAEKRDDMRS